MKKQRGFTLIEILIVVVILAILATLVLPKILAQPEGAAVAEANQMLGSLKRAQRTSMNLRESDRGMPVTQTGGNAGGEATVGCDADCQNTWARMGLRPPVNARFTYECDGAEPTALGVTTGTTCTARRVVDGNASTIVMNYTAEPVVFSCTGRYTLATDATRGCVIV